MMDDPSIEGRTNETTELIAAVPVQMVSEGRVEVMSKMSPVTVTCGSTVPSELITAQYINLHRVPDTLSSADLLTHHVDLATTAADFTTGQHGTITTQYYTEDLLSPELSEEDRRLAAELVAVQFKHNQQQATHQNQILHTSLGALHAAVNLSDAKQQHQAISTAIVTGYIQAVEDEVVHQHLLEQQQENERCILKIYQQQQSATAQELQQVLTKSAVTHQSQSQSPTLQQQTQHIIPLPPLKKVLSSQSMVLRSKFQQIGNTQHENDGSTDGRHHHSQQIMVELPANTIITNTKGGCVIDDGNLKTKDVIDKIRHRLVSVMDGGRVSSSSSTVPSTSTSTTSIRHSARTASLSSGSVLPAVSSTTTSTGTALFTAVSSGSSSSNPTGVMMDDIDSDYDAESDNTRPSRRSLPHKKRIPHKLKAPPTRSIHTKCYKCNKCGESFNNQSSVSAHKLTHHHSSTHHNTKRSGLIASAGLPVSTSSAVPVGSNIINNCISTSNNNNSSSSSSSNSSSSSSGNNNSNVGVNNSSDKFKTEVGVFSCELCLKSFDSQLRFFEHLKSHYEPLAVVSLNDSNDNTASNIGAVNGVNNVSSDPVDSRSSGNHVIKSANVSSDNSSSISVTNVVNEFNSLVSDNLPELTPAPIVATCISPLSHQPSLAKQSQQHIIPQQHTIVSGSGVAAIAVANTTNVNIAQHTTTQQQQQASQIVTDASALVPGAVTQHAAQEQPLINGVFTIKDELHSDVIKEEIVTSTNLACSHCGESFKRFKPLEAHVRMVHTSTVATQSANAGLQERHDVITSQQHHSEIEEFSEPEDMMEGLRHVVNIPTVDSGDEDQQHQNVGSSSNTEQCISVDDVKVKWRFHHDDAAAVVAAAAMSQEFNAMDLQDMCNLTSLAAASTVNCTTTTLTATLNHHHNQTVNHHVIHNSTSTQHDSSLLEADHSVTFKDEDEMEIDETEIKLGCTGHITGMATADNSNNMVGHQRVNNSGSNNNNSGGKKPLVCTHCDRSFNHRNSLLYHIRSHSGQRPHQCDVCGKSFFSASALKVHMRLHNGDKPYKCEFCGRHFRQWGDLKYHVTSIHSDEKQFQCEYCGKDFARKYSLIVHRRIHTGEKNYKCEYCNKTFRASSYLQNHRRIHTGEKPHACDICGKPFRVRSDMKRHRQTHSRERQVASHNNTSATSRANSGSSLNGNIEHITNSDQEDDPDDNLTEPENILPDSGSSIGTPLNLNIRRGDGSNDHDPGQDDDGEPVVEVDATSATGITYSRAALERDGNTLYVWIPTQTDGAVLADE